MSNYINRIEEIEAEVTQDWRAADGGLTWAARELLDVCSHAKACIEQDNVARGWSDAWDPFEARTGLEAEVCSLVQQWAGERRKQSRIENRKDMIIAINNIAWDVFEDYRATPTGSPSTTPEEQAERIFLHRLQEEAEFRGIQRVLDALRPSDSESEEALNYPELPWSGHGKLNWEYNDE